MSYILLSEYDKLKRGDYDEDPLVFLVDQILYNAISMRASDVHLEPGREKMRVRYRVDGVLYDQKSIAQDKMLSVLSRLKILAGLDIAIKRVPQDGKLQISLKTERDSYQSHMNVIHIDLRISTFPTVYGEKMVIRILKNDWSSNKLSLKNLGCNQKTFEKIISIIEQPQGFFLVTGPTGSGKTTSLYAMLLRLNKSTRNIVTMEDPVEYHIEGISQSQINPKAGFSFERGLRSLLRQDPDIVMVGEIRDRQTAQIAIEAALTGHLVFSTLHTNDSVGAITRLLDMGIEPFLITASLVGVLAQRLVCVLCEHCKERVALCKEVIDFLKLRAPECDITEGYIARGCDRCAGLGHCGRTGIFELLIIDDALRALVASNSIDVVVLRQRAVQNGLTLLFYDAIDKVRAGLIAVEEVLRVLG